MSDKGSRPQNTDRSDFIAKYTAITGNPPPSATITEIGKAHWDHPVIMGASSKHNMFPNADCSPTASVGSGPYVRGAYIDPVTKRVLRLCVLAAAALSGLVYAAHHYELDKYRKGEVPYKSAQPSKALPLPERVMPGPSPTHEAASQQIVKLAETKLREAANKLTIEDIEGASRNWWKFSKAFQETAKVQLLPADAKWQVSPTPTNEEIRFTVRAYEFDPTQWGKLYNPKDFIQYGSDQNMPQFYFLVGEVKYPDFKTSYIDSPSCKANAQTACSKKPVEVRDSNKEAITTDIIIAAIDEKGHRIKFFNLNAKELSVARPQ